MLASLAVLKSSSRLGLLRRSPPFGYLFLATAGSSFGTYLAAVALTLQVYDATGSGTWVAALLIADFLPIVVIGLPARPARRPPVAASADDRVRPRPLRRVRRAALRRRGRRAHRARGGLRASRPGFFLPAANAAIPNLVPEEELVNANSLVVTVETLSWMIGPVAAGLMVTAWGPTVPYAVNAVTFLVSAAFVAAISERSLRSEDSLTRGHWRDVADGLRLVFTASPLRTVLVVWNVALVGSAAVNVAEVVFAKETLDAGDVGFGALVAASGIGLAFGSFLSAPALGKVGLRRTYVSSFLLMGVGWGAAALSGSIWLAVAFVVGGAAGNGSVIVCNRLLVQRGAPDQYRGRALATIMSSNYAVLGLAMAAAGVLTDQFGARAVWVGAGVVYLFAAVVALVLTRWLPGCGRGRAERVRGELRVRRRGPCQRERQRSGPRACRPMAEAASVRAGSSASRRSSRRSRRGARPRRGARS